MPSAAFGVFLHPTQLFSLPGSLANVMASLRAVSDFVETAVAAFGSMDAIESYTY
jgi:hypothetical protein